MFKIKLLSESATFPLRGSKYSAGLDLSSASLTDIIVPARGKALIPTDLKMKIPEGTYGRIAPRSGLAWKNSIDVGAGVIDFDYRGAVGVILFNHSDKDFIVKHRDRIAQYILVKIDMTEPKGWNSLDDEEENEKKDGRGTSGFGSTGVNEIINK